MAKKQSELTFGEVIRTLGNALVFNKGYQKTGLILWFVIVIVGGTLIFDTSPSGDATDRSDSQVGNYRELCAAGDYNGAQEVVATLYADYSEMLSKWRSGAWCDREVREKQEKYHTAFAYVFSQRLTAHLAENIPSADNAILSLLITIPVEGAPLPEGQYGSGMFYDNDAGIGEMAAIDHVVYQSWVRFFNDRCDQALDLALIYEHKELAKKVSKLYKTEVNTRYEQDTVLGDNYRIATVTYDNSRREAAAKKCE